MPAARYGPDGHARVRVKIRASRSGSDDALPTVRCCRRDEGRLLPSARTQPQVLTTCAAAADKLVLADVAAMADKTMHDVIRSVQYVLKHTEETAGEGLDVLDVTRQ